MSNDTTTTTKEQAFNEQILPLMKEVIAVCQTHRIAFLADFEISTEDTFLSSNFIQPDQSGKNTIRHNCAQDILLLGATQLEAYIINGDEATQVNL